MHTSNIVEMRKFLKFTFLALVVLLAGSFSSNAQDLAEGETIWNQNCTSCHAVNRKVVGPALAGVTAKYEEEWLISWIRNSQAMVKAGDPRAVAIFNEYNQSVMTAYPNLSDDNIRNVLAFINAEDARLKQAKLEVPAGGGASSGGSGTSGFTLWGLVAVIFLLFLVIFILNRVIGTLERLLLQKQGIITEAEAKEAEAPKDYMAPVKRFAANKKAVAITSIVVIILLSSYGWNVMWNVGVQQGYAPAQPIKFSHKLHAGLYEMDCQYCHSGAWQSKNASIPSANVCMNCHSYVQATENYNGEISPEIQKIYTALDYDPNTGQYGPNPKPIEWIRIHNLPDFAYFNHAQHVNVAGIECQTCHGEVEGMEVVYQFSPLTMGWCIDCHRQTDMSHAHDNAYYDKLLKAHEALKKGEKLTVSMVGGLECAKCHY